MARIAVVSMSGARNRGCEALARCTLDAIRFAFPAGRYQVDLHSEDPAFDSAAFGDAFVNVYRQYPLMFPRHGYRPTRNRLAYTVARNAERFAPRRLRRYRSLSAMRRSDLIIWIGGDVLTSDYQTLTSHTSSLLMGRPVVLLGHTIGPFAPADEKYFFNALGNVVLCTCRESRSFDYMRSSSAIPRIRQTSDLAFGLQPAGEARVREILEVEHRFPIDDGPMVGFAVSAGLLSYRRDVNRGDYFGALLEFLNLKNRQGYRFVLIPHVQEKYDYNNDLTACLEVLRNAETPSANVALSTPLTASEFKGVIGKCVGLVGARTHATIASMSQAIPTVAIAYSRKAWGIMADYYGEDLARELTIEARDLTSARLTSALETALELGRTDEQASRAKLGALENHKALREVAEELRLADQQVQPHPVAEQAL